MTTKSRLKADPFASVWRDQSHHDIAFIRKVANRYRSPPVARRQNPEVHQSVRTNWRTFTDGSGLTSDVYRNPTVMTRYYRFYSGRLTPNFKRVKKKDLPFNPYHLEMYGWTPIVHRQSVRHEFSPGIWGTWKSEGEVHNALSYALSNGHQDQAESQCIRNSYEVLEGVKVNLAQFFAERHQTINMIASTARRIVHAVNSLRRLRLKDAYSSLGIQVSVGKLTAFERFVYGNDPKGFTSDGRSYKAILRAHKVRRIASLPEPVRADLLLSRYWLELQYGWRPLLQDVRDTAELLAGDYAAARPQNLKVTGKHRESVQAVCGDDYFSTVKVGDVAVKSVCKYAFAAVPSDSAINALRVTGITNPALLAWELLPYSFVIDWFYPVANYLKALEVHSEFTISSVARTRFTLFNFLASESYDYTKEFFGKWIVVGGFTGSGWKLWYDRDILPTLPSALPPEFKNPVSVTHAMNAIALLTTALSRR